MELLLPNSGNLEDNSIFREYQRLINLIAPDGLSRQTLENISELKCFNGYVTSVADQLYTHGLLMDFILLSLLQERAIPFEQPDIQTCLRDKCQWLHEFNSELFVRLRLKVSESSHSVLEQYAFMYASPYPILTAEELERVKITDDNCDTIIMKLVSENSVTTDMAKILSRFFARKRQKNAAIHDILQFIARFPSESAKACFLNLDFDKVCYRRISKQRKSDIKERFEDILQLNTPEGKLEFMERTNFLEDKWIEELTDTMAENESLQRSFVKICNSVSNITPAAIRAICAFNAIYPMHPNAAAALFDAGKYSEYVIAKILETGEFVMEDDKRGKMLWPAYVAVFKGNDNRATGDTRERMAKNKAFLRQIMQQKLYTDMQQEERLWMANIYQDADCLEEVSTLGDDFMLDYFVRIDGFVDEVAAGKFVDIVTRSRILLASQSVYDHTYSKLVDPALKSRYTRARNNQS